VFVILNTNSCRLCTKIRRISGFRRDVHEICVLLGYYAA